MKSTKILKIVLAIFSLALVYAFFFPLAPMEGMIGLLLSAPIAVGMIEHSHEGKQYRAEVWEEMNSMIEVRKTEKRDFTESEKKKYEGLRKRFDEFTIKIEELEGDEKRRLQMAGIEAKRLMQQFHNSTAQSGWINQRTGEPVTVLERSEKLTEVLSKNSFDRSGSNPSGTLGAIIRGIITGNWEGINPETRTALSTTTQGTLVPIGLFPQVVDASRAKSVVFGGGAKLVLMDNGKMVLAKVSEDPTMEVKAENDAFSDNGMDFEPIDLNAYTIGGLLKISNELLQDSPNAASAIETAVAGALAAELDRLALFGLGTTEPLGVLNTIGVEEVPITDKISYTPAISAWTKIAENNGEPNVLAMAPRDFAILQTQVTDSGFLVKPDLFKAVEFRHSSVIPTNGGVGENQSTALLGDFAQIVIGLRQNVVIEASRVSEDAFKRNQTHLRILWRGDVGVLKPAHFAKITGILPATPAAPQG